MATLSNLYLDANYEDFATQFVVEYQLSDELSKLTMMRELLTKWRHNDVLTKVITELKLTC